MWETTCLESILGGWQRRGPDPVLSSTLPSPVCLATSSSFQIGHKILGFCTAGQGQTRRPTP